MAGKYGGFNRGLNFTRGNLKHVPLGSTVHPLHGGHAGGDLLDRLEAIGDVSPLFRKKLLEQRAERARQKPPADTVRLGAHPLADATQEKTPAVRKNAPLKTLSATTAAEEEPKVAEDTAASDHPLYRDADGSFKRGLNWTRKNQPTEHPLQPDEPEKDDDQEGGDDAGDGTQFIAKKDKPARRKRPKRPKKPFPPVPASIVVETFAQKYFGSPPSNAGNTFAPPASNVLERIANRFSDWSRPTYDFTREDVRKYNLYRLRLAEAFLKAYDATKGSRATKERAAGQALLDVPKPKWDKGNARELGQPLQMQAHAGYSPNALAALAEDMASRGIKPQAVVTELARSARFYGIRFPGDKDAIERLPAPAPEFSERSPPFEGGASGSSWMPTDPTFEPLPSRMQMPVLNREDYNRLTHYNDLDVHGNLRPGLNGSERNAVQVIYNNVRDAAVKGGKLPLGSDVLKWLRAGGNADESHKRSVKLARWYSEWATAADELGDYFIRLGRPVPIPRGSGDISAPTPKGPVPDMPRILNAKAPAPPIGSPLRSLADVNRLNNRNQLQGTNFWKTVRVLRKSMAGQQRVTQMQNEALKRKGETPLDDRGVRILGEIAMYRLIQDALNN